MIKIPEQISQLLPKKNKVIGLDIGCSSIKLAEFLWQGAKPVLSQLKMQETSGQNNQLGALKKIFEDIDLQAAKINVVINCPQSTSMVLTIPHMPKAEIPQALKWEIKNFISFPIEEAVFDYKIIQEIIEEGVKRIGLVVAWSPQATVNKYLNFFNQIKVEPAQFTLACFALRNIIKSLVPEKEKTVAIVDIGYNFSEFYIFDNQEFTFMRKLPVAGVNFTKNMSQVLVSDLGKTQLAPEQAERIKQKYGIPDAATSEVLEGTISSAQLLSLLRPNVEKLATEIERSLDFYREKKQGARPERLIILGGGSQLKNLAKNLADSLDIPVELGNPLRGLALGRPALLKEKTGSAHRFAQAVGVALNPADEINLLPVEIKEKTQLLVKRSSLKALITAIIVICLLSYIGMLVRLGVYQQRIAVAKLELDALSKQAGDVQKKTFLAEVSQGCTLWSDVLKEVANRIPEQIRLTEMQGDNGKLMLKGEIAASDKPFEKVLTEFMALMEQGICKQVNLVSSQKDLAPNKPYLFQLKLIVQ